MNSLTVRKRTFSRTGILAAVTVVAIGLLFATGALTQTAPSLDLPAAPYDNGSEPDSGTTDPTNVTFRIIYTDPENLAPTTAQVEIYTDQALTTAYAASPYAMTEVYPTPHDYSVGELFEVSVNLTSPASYYFFFYFEDTDAHLGLQTVRYPVGTGTYLGPIVVNQPPTFANAAVPGDNGQADAYVFSVEYTDADDQAPAAGVTLWIENITAGTGWQSFAMAVDATAPAALQNGVYTDGERYTLTAYGVNPGDNEIGDGHHRFYYAASDGTDDVRSPSAGYHAGPTVNDAPNAVTSGFDPTGGAIVSTSTPTISWDAATDPNATDPASTLSYRVEFSAAPPFTVDATYTVTTAAGTTSAQPAAAITPNGTYYYRIITIDNDAAESAASAVQTFEVMNEVPTWTGVTADQFSPTGDITTTTPLLEWPRGTDADDADEDLMYRAEVDDNSNFTSPEYQSGWLGEDIRQALVSSALSEGVTYNWRVQIRDDDDGMSLWTNEVPLDLQFTVLVNHRPLPPSDGFSPAEGVNDGETHTATPTFTWNEGSDPDVTDTPDTLHYEVQLDDDADWADGQNLLTGGDEVTGPGETSTTMITSTPLAIEDGEYWWRVRTVDDQGATSDWSATQTFWLNLANNAPDAPISGFSPTGGVVVPDPPSSLNPTPDPLTWDAAIDPDHSDDAAQLRYIVQLSTDDSFAVVTYELTTAYDVTQMDTPTDLTRGVMWYWRVRAEDDDGAQSGWSHAGGLADPAPSFYVNQPPVLSLAPAPYDDGVDPNAGGQSDPYIFQVVYTDADDDPPSPISAMITNTTTTTGPTASAMTPRDPGPYDFTAGVVYQVVTGGFGIGDGDHTFYFEAEDGVVTTPVQLYFADPTVEFDGPKVNDPPFPPTEDFDPTGGAYVFTVAPTISWDDGTDPNPTDTSATLSYRVEFSLTEEPFSIQAAYTATTAAGTTTAQPMIALPEGTWFYRVITIDDDGAESAPSVVQEFVVHINQFPLVPEPVAEYIPADGDVIRSTTPLFQWPEATDPDPLDTPATLHYEIQVDDDIDFSSLVIDAATVNGVTQYQTLPGEALSFDTQYYWHVRTVDSHGDPSGWTEVELGLSEPINFTVTINAVLDQPTLAPVYGSLTTWFYFTIVYTDPDDLPPTGPIQVDIGNGHFVADMTRDPADLDAWTAGVTYECYVRGSDLGYGTYSHYFLAPEMSLRYPAAPGTLFGPVVGSGSSLRFTDAAWSNVAGYEEGDTAYIELTDADENENSGAAETVQVTLSEESGSDTELVTLTETGDDTGRFRGSMPTLGRSGFWGDGTLNVMSGPTGNTITVAYTDSDGSGDSSSDTALVTDTVAPAALAAGELTVTTSADGVQATLQWGAYDEAAQIDVDPDGGYHAYQSTSAFTDTSAMTPVATIASGTQSTTVGGLTVGQDYYFAVGPFDSVPNEDHNVTTAMGTTSDDNAPYLSNEAPAPDATEAALDSNVSFDINDDGIGVNQATIVVEVNGVDVTAQCTLTPKGPAAIGVVYDPPTDFGYNETVTVHVVAEDDSGNVMDTTYQFYTVTDVQAPQVANRDFSATEGWVSFDLTDDVSGVDTATIVVTINGDDVTADCVIDDTNPLNVAVQYDAPDGWAWNTQVTIAVVCSDFAGNAMAEESWQEDADSDDTAPVADQLNPADGATDVPVSTSISLRIRDAESGVDQGSVQMTVDGEDVTSELALKRVKGEKGVSSLDVTYQPATDLDWAAQIDVSCQAADDVGNPMTVNWSFTTQSETTYSISGEVADQDGEALVGVELTAGDQTLLSDGNGVYRFTGLVAGDYAVTPSRDEYDFEPVAAQVTLGPNAQHIDFVGTRRTYSISGSVSADGTGVANVRVEVEPGGHSDTTNAAGDFSVSGVPSAVYTVICVEDVDGDGYSDYRYTPHSQNVNVAGASVTGVDFNAAAVTYGVSGTVSDNVGNRIAGVTIAATVTEAATAGAAETAQALTAVTNEAGRYTISGVAAGTLTLTASKSAMAFDPETIEVTVPPESSENDFIAYHEYTHSFPAGLSMLAVPCSPPSGRAAATDVFGTTTVARWDTAASPPGYVTGDTSPNHPELVVRPGAAFFVNFGGVTNLSVPGSAVSGGGTFSLSLSAGWTMVGNMYEVALPMANINVTGGEARPFAFIYDSASGSYQMLSRQAALNAARNYLEPWEGAWFRALGTGASLTVTAPAGVTSADLAVGEAAKAEVSEGGWLVPIVARVAGRADLTTVAGVGSGDEAAGYVVHNPPKAPGSVDVYLTRGNGERLAHYVQPQSGATRIEWPFVVETDLSESEVQVLLPDLSAVPNELAVYLVDGDANRRMYARTLPAYSFTSGANGAKRHFRLVVEPRGTDNLVIKSASVQATKGAGAVVTYEVTKSCQVSIEVLNIAGRRVRQLAAGKAVSAGVTEEVWNLRSDSGTTAPNGEYLVKIEAAAADGQRVQALRRVQVAR